MAVKRDADVRSTVITFKQFPVSEMLYVQCHCGRVFQGYTIEECRKARRQMRHHASSCVQWEAK